MTEWTYELRDAGQFEEPETTLEDHGEGLFSFVEQLADGRWERAFVTRDQLLRAARKLQEWYPKDLGLKVLATA